MNLSHVFYAFMAVSTSLLSTDETVLFSTGGGCASEITEFARQSKIDVWRLSDVLVPKEVGPDVEIRECAIGPCHTYLLLKSTTKESATQKIRAYLASAGENDRRSVCLKTGMILEKIK